MPHGVYLRMVNCHWMLTTNFKWVTDFYFPLSDCFTNHKSWSPHLPQYWWVWVSRQSIATLFCYIDTGTEQQTGLKLGKLSRINNTTTTTNAENWKLKSKFSKTTKNWNQNPNKKEIGIKIQNPKSEPKTQKFSKPQKMELGDQNQKLSLEIGTKYNLCLGSIEIWTFQSFK